MAKTSITVDHETYLKLHQVKLAMSATAGRVVTFAEVIQKLLADQEDTPADCSA